MKKWIALILTLVMAATLLAGCGGTKNDVEKVKEKGKLVVGMTDFAPMDYQEEGSDEWIGFDADMAKAFAEYLGVKAEFVEITWANKATELSTGAIDVVWNGMTLNDEVRGLMGTGVAYCRNAQVVVVNKDVADQYATTDSLSSLKFAVEQGSAGAEALDDLGITYTGCDTQAKALMEVAAGAADACVIDLLMAGAMIGEGTSYPQLTVAVELAGEEYGVGFRKESALIDEFNTFWKQAYDSGKVMQVAEQYGIAQNIIAQ